MRELSLLYTPSDRIGYGRLGVKLHTALEELGIKVYSETAADTKLPEHYTNVLGYVSLPTHTRRWYEGQYVFTYSMWETDRLPDIYLGILPSIDCVIVPSKENLDLFSEHHGNVHYVPLAIDKDWTYVARQPDERFFRFLISGSDNRKGVDLVYRAFHEAFPDIPNMERKPILMIHSNRAHNMTGEFVEQINGKITRERELEIYSMADCYVQPSRGEGFGLRPLQAIAQGIPTILTDAHGHRAFSHLAYARLSAELVENHDFNMLGFTNGQRWWEPNYDELVHHMRQIYEDAEQIDVTGQCIANSEAAHRTFTWTHTAFKLATAIGRPLEDPYRGDGSIVHLEQPQYLIRVTKPFKAQIAGDVLVLEPGQDYYDIADIKRLLFKSEILHPSCLTDEANCGLTPEQVAELPHYNARNAYCPNCKRHYNTGTPMVDDLVNGNLQKSDLLIGR